MTTQLCLLPEDPCNIPKATTRVTLLFGGHGLEYLMYPYSSNKMLTSLQTERKLDTNPILNRRTSVIWRSKKPPF